MWKSGVDPRTCCILHEALCSEELHLECGRVLDLSLKTSPCMKTIATTILFL